MGHIPIVNQETLQKVISEGCISTRGKLEDYKVKTIADLFADALTTRVGDLVFPWIIGSKSSANIGFKYVFKVADRPYFVNGDEYPIKIPLKETGEEYEIPLSEAEALDLWGGKLLWNIIGKKSLGRGRSLSHQTKMEDNLLIEKLKKKNNGRRPANITLGRYTSGGLPITINPSQIGNPNFELSLDRFDPDDRLKNVQLSDIPWQKDGAFTEEKVLEAWLMENIDKPACSNLRQILMSPGQHIDWFGNYLPYGVQGSNIDIVISQLNGSHTVSVIELKVNRLSKTQIIEAAAQVEEYSAFIEKAFKAFNVNVSIKSIIISHSHPTRRDNNGLGKLPITSIVYNIQSSGEVNFVKE
ncbi:MAG: hypothetical protein QXN16_03395 [Candidatus Micrarchaeaceae archaeon]